MSLPQSLLKQLWDAGYGGKVIRVPARNERLQLKVIANQILKDAEDIYESKGTTFVFGKKRSIGLLPLVRRAQALSPLSSKHRRSQESSPQGLWAVEPLVQGV